MHIAFCLLFDLGLLQVSYRRTLEHLSFETEARTVAGAVPTPLCRVPRNDAPEMGADRGDGMHLAPRVPVDGDSFAAHRYDGAPTAPPVNAAAFGDADPVTH